MTTQPRLLRLGAAKVLTQAVLFIGMLESKDPTNRWGF
jgi:hypothetical protein